MITQSKNLFRFLLMLAPLLFLSFSARAQNASLYVTLGAAVAPSSTQPLALNGSAAGSSYVVPAGMVLVLTDFYIAPQYVPTGVTNYQININDAGNGSNNSWALYPTSSEPTSFVDHMTTGMMILPGQHLNVSMWGPYSVAVTVYGHLLPE